MILSGYDEFTKDIELVSYDEVSSSNELKLQYLNWLNDMDVVKPIISPVLNIENKPLSFVEESFCRFTSETCRGFFIKYENIYVGTIKLDGIDEINKRAEIGIMIGEKNLWGKQIGLKSYLILMRYGFEELKLNRIYGGTAQNNKRMQNLFLKSGFKEEGKLREYSYYEGEYLDNYLYSILKKEWKK